MANEDLNAEIEQLRKQLNRLQSEREKSREAALARLSDADREVIVARVELKQNWEEVATLLDQIEQAKGYDPINIHILIETARGMANVEAIAQTCPERLEAMVFGVADYAASTQARSSAISAPLVV